MIPHSSVEGFFQEVLTEALESHGLSTSESTEVYLVGLLGEFSHARIPDEPLSLKLVEAAEASDRLRALKEVGDTSLYVTGFFASSLGRSLVGVDYYMDLGKTAYRELSLRLASSSVGEVYDELASKFPRFVDVLARIRLHVDCMGQDVVRLYEEWLKTRSEWIERRLRSLGVIITPSDPTGSGYLQ